MPRKLVRIFTLLCFGFLRYPKRVTSVVFLVVTVFLLELIQMIVASVIHCPIAIPTRSKCKVSIVKLLDLNCMGQGQIQTDGKTT
jgi:hypothetical protein